MASLSCNSSAFLALPVEIRRHIYGFCIPQKLRYDVGSTLCYRNCPNWFSETSDNHRHSPERNDAEERDGDDDDESKREIPTNTHVEEVTGALSFNDDRNAIPELLLCCHQITEEVLEMLYGENTFQVNIQDDESTLADLLTPETREKIRRMVLILQPNKGLFYRPNHHRMDPDVWDGILGNLQVLGVIVEQPESHSEEEQLERAAETEEEEEEEDAFEEWTTRITSIFGYIRRALNRKAKILVDVNDEQRTVELIEEAMPERCHFRRLSIADFIFKRGQFAPASGFWAGYWDFLDDDPVSGKDIINDCDYELYYSD